MSVPDTLVAAYQAALYEVDVTAESTLTLQIGETCDRLLHAHGATTAAFLTAYNPRSRKQSAEDNAAAHRALLEAVARMGKVTLPARGRDPKGEWPMEPGLFILDLTREQALALARRFGQYALVWLESGAPAALVCAA